MRQPFGRSKPFARCPGSRFACSLIERVCSERVGVVEAGASALCAWAETVEKVSGNVHNAVATAREKLWYLASSIEGPFCLQCETEALKVFTHVS